MTKVEGATECRDYSPCTCSMVHEGTLTPGENKTTCCVFSPIWLFSSKFQTSKVWNIPAFNMRNCHNNGTNSNMHYSPWVYKHVINIDKSTWKRTLEDVLMKGIEIFSTLKFQVNKNLMKKRLFFFFLNQSWPWVLICMTLTCKGNMHDLDL